MRRLHMAINSVVIQAKNCEILIIDDASPNRIELSSDVFCSIPHCIIRHDTNLGAAAARNTGLENAQAQLVSFLDYDDILLAETLQKRLSWARGEGQFSSILDEPHHIQGCGWKEITLANEIRKTRYPAPATMIDDFCRGCWFCPGSTIIANRDFLRHAVGGFNRDYRRLEDADLFLRAGLKGAKFTPVPILGASILHHRNKSPDEIYKAATLMASHYLMPGTPLTSRQKQLLRAYLATERANAALIEKRYGMLSIHALHYFCNFPSFSPRWSEKCPDT